MEVFGLEVPHAVRAEIVEHAVRDYPNEACGVVLGKDTLERVVPLRNVQDEYHALEPDKFPRTAKDAYRVDDQERLKLLSSTDLEERILYHSHCDAGAYFSPADRADALVEGVELLPGIVYVVVSVRGGRAVDMAAYKYLDGKWMEARLSVDEEQVIPDLETRRMDGGEMARPIKPVGPGLCLRRVTRAEAASFAGLAEGRQIQLSDAQARDVKNLGLGALSPLTGFMRAADAFSVDLKGRLQSGTPWRTPLMLEVPKRGLTAIPGGSVVELVHGGETMALMIAATLEVVKDKMRLGGPVYVYATEEMDCAESRAALVRRGAKKVLAHDKLLDGYDAVIGVDLPRIRTGRGEWLDAVAAQNQGATHVVVTDRAVVAQISESLEITPLLL